MNQINQRILLILITSWLSTSMLIDFVALPITFRTIEVMMAGQIGIKIFSLYNIVEVLFSLGIVFCTIKLVKDLKSKTQLSWKKNWLPVTFAMVLLVIAFMYKFYLTPQIASLTAQLPMASPNTDLYLNLKDSHAFFHRLYVRMDGFKIMLLFTYLLIVGFFPSKNKVEV